jgi:hypothetical protein
MHVEHRPSLTHENEKFDADIREQLHASQQPLQMNAGDNK